MLDSLTDFDWSMMAEVDSDKAVKTLFMQLEVMNWKSELWCVTRVKGSEARVKAKEAIYTMDSKMLKE